MRPPLVRAFVFLAVVLIAACATSGRARPDRPAVTRERAIAIARADAVQNYADLDGHRHVETKLEDGKWYVRWVLELEYRGGGPRYVIDADSGEILYKFYEQ